MSLWKYHRWPSCQERRDVRLAKFKVDSEDDKAHGLPWNTWGVKPLGYRPVAVARIRETSRGNISLVAVSFWSFEVPVCQKVDSPVPAKKGIRKVQESTEYVWVLDVMDETAACLQLMYWQLEDEDHEVCCRWSWWYSGFPPKRLDVLPNGFDFQLWQGRGLSFQVILAKTSYCDWCLPYWPYHRIL